MAKTYFSNNLLKILFLLIKVYLDIQLEVISLDFFHKNRQDLQNEFSRGTFSVALTSDVWSGRTKQDYVSIMAYYINGE